MKTTWRPVVGYEGRYEVSSDGQLRTLKGQPVGQWPNDQGYMYVRLSGPRKMCRVHRLVAEAFIPNPQSLPFINHRDNAPAHNAVENLEWCTQKQNLGHARAQGRMPDNHWKGKRSPNAKLSEETVAKVRTMYQGGGWSLERLGKHLGISKRTIGRIVARKAYV